MLQSNGAAVLAAAALFLLPVGQSSAEERPGGRAGSEAVGALSNVKGGIEIVRDGAARPGRPGELIYRSDMVGTSAGASATIEFRDGSRLSLGERAEALVTTYIPEQGRKLGVLMLEVVRGAFRLTVAKPRQAPDKRVELRTALASISTGNADVWSGPLEAGTAVLAISGKVQVRTDAGSVTLDRDRAATMVKSRSRPPSEPIYWPGERVKSTLAQADQR